MCYAFSNYPSWFSLLTDKLDYGRTNLKNVSIDNDLKIKILEKNEITGFFHYDVEHVEGIGTCATLEDSRLRIFKQLVGGEAKDFVRIDGTSTMTGELKIDDDNKITSDNAYITKGLSLPRDLSTLPDINQP